MGSVEFGIPAGLAAALACDRGIAAAVETGTYRGDSAALLRTICERVWSIELVPTQHAEAVARNVGASGIEFLLGDSTDLLPELLDRIDEPALFWLDGHAMPGDRNGALTECPVLAEINAINGAPHGSEACILIDDAVLFLAAPHANLRVDDWPTILEVVDRLRTPHERYVTVLDDVVIAGPPEIKETVDRWWQEVVRTRGGSTTMVPLDRLLQAWNPTPKEAVRRLGKALLPAVVARARGNRDQSAPRDTH